MIFTGAVLLGTRPRLLISLLLLRIEIIIRRKLQEVLTIVNILI